MRKGFIIKIYIITIVFISGINAFGQVNVLATSGIPSAIYPTLNSAFNAINGGLHQGMVSVEISANIIEPGPAVLNSNGAGSALYQSIKIYPVNDSIIISGVTGSGRGLVELNGADSITIDGDNPNTAGIHRNLSFMNLDADTTNYNACIRIATSTSVLSSNEITIKNCNIIGSAVNKNQASVTSYYSSANTTFGIYAGGNGGSAPTSPPSSLTSVTANIIPSGSTSNNFVVDNCYIISCAKGIGFLGLNTTNSNSVNISNNFIGNQSTTLSGAPPINSPTNTVYTKGIVVRGTNSVNIAGNTIKNIVSSVVTPMVAIELYGAIGTGPINITNNTINGLCRNAPIEQETIGIWISNSAGSYNIGGNSISNILAKQTGATIGIQVNTLASSGTIEKNKINHVYNYHFQTYGSYGILLFGGSNITAQNNFISDLNHDMSFGAAASPEYMPVGIMVWFGTDHKIYYNSVNLYGSMLGTPAPANYTASFAVYYTSSTGMDVRNNIFSNNMTGGTSPRHVSIVLPSGGNSGMNLTLNNNAYYCGTNSASQGIGLVGYAGATFFLPGNFNPASTGPGTNLRSYTSILNISGTNDNASFASTLTAPFMGSSDLHINNTLPNSTDLDAEGVDIISVVNDIDLDIRDTVTPDIGADEFGTPICSSVDAGLISVNNSSICEGENIILTDSGATNDALGVSYQWMVSSTPGGPYVNVSGGTGSTTVLYSSDSLNTGTYYYVMSATCSTGPVTDLSNEIPITVNPIPTSSISSPSNICEGDTITLSGLSDVGTTFTWSGPNGFSSTLQNPVINNITLLDTGVYDFVATANGCTSLVAIDTINVNSLPNINAGSDTLVCPLSEVILNATGGDSYDWIGLSTSNPQSVYPGSTTTFIVTGYDIIGCYSHDTITVQVSVFPNLVFNIVEDTLCTSYSPLNLVATPAGGIFSGSGVAGSTFNPAISGTGNQIITYAYTNGDGCINDTSETIFVSPCLGLEQNEISSIMIFPNPFNTQFELRAEETIDKIEVQDIHGRIVYMNYASSSSVTVDGSSWRSGVYLIRAYHQSNVTVMRIIKN